VFSPKVQNILKSYVYAYIHPITGIPFYIGQGKGNRAFEHLRDNQDTEKVRVIRDLQGRGMEPEIVILRHGLSAEDAKLVESVCIDFAQLDNLSNRVNGKYSKMYGRASIEELQRRYDAPIVEVSERCIAININSTYKPGMTDREIYECTRGIWTVGQAKTEADYALAIYQDVILEVYAIKGWFPAGAVFSERTFTPSGRHEFVGNVDPAMSAKYKGKSQPGLFKKGKRNPIRYLPIKKKDKLDTGAKS